MAINRGKIEAAAWVNSIKPHALQSQRASGVPAAVTISQACQETGFGKRIIPNSNNLFNIKGTGPAGHVMAWTTEYNENKRSYKIRAKFKAYHSFTESFLDHAHLLSTEYLNAMAVRNDPVKFAYALVAIPDHKYATDPTYATSLIKIMKIFGLLDLKLEAPKPAQNEGGVVTMGDLLKNEPWAVKAVQDLKKEGLIVSDHDPDEPVKFGLLAKIQINMLNKLREEMRK